MPTVQKLTQENLQWCLELAKKVFTFYIENNEILEVPIEEIPPRLLEHQACFVTYKKQQQLRGCIGSIFPTCPLYQEITRQAVHAAVEDPRFPPISKSELPLISIEVTILSPTFSIPTPHEFIVGEHGIILRQGQRSAVFLPQVAEEQGWGMEETLMHLSLKAGLPQDAWQNPDTCFEVFFAQKISQEK
ncbi:AmmeMemoRadiSam system protein A [Candidatus Uabimicrobium amorphum]|uniref:AmmeMemoRadiSam system protein A n=1 Tax=Uabimicrobium amorphum TaxID=2596890 RepID=A0A5S9F4U3_UABAM|nr:AmmeMemoRadiSam system protein A [Candidatus Uabimicrobium amorphum]BBM84844.1 AmmeMemoRadiSam system protein A [Candidatus Uabimicrobium amorphum]